MYCYSVSAQAVCGKCCVLDKSLRVPGGRTLQVLVLCRMNTVVVTLVMSHMPKHVGRDGPLTSPIGVQCTMLCMCVKGHIVFSKQCKANSEHAEYTDPHLAKQYDMHGTANSCSAKIFLVFKKGIVRHSFPDLRTSSLVFIAYLDLSAGEGSKAIT